MALGLDESRERIEEIGWVTEHVADLDADFLAIYGIDDMLSLPAARWLRLAYRVSAYEGVMAARLRTLQEEKVDEVPAAAGDGAITSGQIAASDALSDVISIC